MCARIANATMRGLVIMAPSSPEIGEQRIAAKFALATDRVMRMQQRIEIWNYAQLSHKYRLTTGDDKRIHLRPADIEARHRMTGFQQILRHRQTHVAEADEADACHPPLPFALIPQEDDPLRIGCDIARYGSDRSVFTLRHGPKVLEMKVYSHADTMTTAQRIADYAALYPTAEVAVDEVGVGIGDGLVFS